MIKRHKDKKVKVGQINLPKWDDINNEGYKAHNTNENLNTLNNDYEYKFFRISLTNLKKAKEANNGSNNKKNGQGLPFCSYCGNKYSFDLINMKCNTCGRNVRKPKNLEENFRHLNPNHPNQKYFNFFGKQNKLEERAPNIDVFRPSIDSTANDKINNRDNCLCNCLIM